MLTPCNRLIDRKGAPGRFFPRKAGRLHWTSRRQIFPQCRITQHLAHRQRPAIDIVWVDLVPRIPGHFRQSTGITDNHRRATSHRLEGGHPKAFVQRREDKRRGSPVPQMLLFLGNIPHKPQFIAQI